MLHLRPHWNNQSHKFVFICNKYFGVVDCTNKSVDWIIKFPKHLCLIKLILFVSADLSLCWILSISSILSCWSNKCNSSGIKFLISQCDIIGFPCRWNSRKQTWFSAIKHWWCVMGNATFHNLLDFVKVWTFLLCLLYCSYH